MTAKNETQEFLRETIDDIATSISLHQLHNKLEWAKANYNYGRFSALLAELEKNVFSDNLYEEAFCAFENALSYYENNNEIIDYCNAALAWSQASRSYALRKGDELGKAYLRKSVKFLQKIIDNIENINFYIIKISLICEQVNLIRDLSSLEPVTSHIKYIHKMINLYDKALKISQQKEDYTKWKHLNLFKAYLYCELSELYPVKKAIYYSEQAISVFTAIVKASELNNEFCEEAALANLELGFLYADLGKHFENKDYIIKAYLAFENFLADTTLKKSNRLLLRINLKKADLSTYHAHLETNKEKKIAYFKTATYLYQPSLKKLKKYNHSSEIKKTYINLADIYDNLASLCSIKKSKIAYLYQALFYYKKNEVLNKTKIINIYMRLAAFETKIAISLLNDHKKLMLRSYKMAIIHLNKASKLVEKNNNLYYEINLKIISILRDVSRNVKPHDIYYKIAQNRLNIIKKSEKFKQAHSVFSKNINKIYKKIICKSLLNKLLGTNF